MDLLVDTPITEPDVEGKKGDIIAGKSLPSFPSLPFPHFSPSQT